MSLEDRFDRDFGAALANLAGPQFPEYFDDVLERAVRGSQRPAWTFPERWLPMGVLTRRSTFVPILPWRTVVLLLTLGLLLAAALAVVIGSQRSVAPPFGLARNGLVAFVAGGDIHVRDLGTDAQRTLIAGPKSEVWPNFSRDGTKLAFFRLEDDDAITTLMVANADGTDVRPLVGPDPGIQWASWSPASDEIAIIAEADGVYSLSVTPIDGGAHREIDVGDIAPVNGVEWRPPDGRELYFLGRDVDGRYAIYAVPSDGKGIARRVSSQGGSDANALPLRLTPDGKRLAYTRFGSTVEVRFLDLDTGEDRRFGGALPVLANTNGDATAHEGYPVFSPDGERILFGRYWDDDGARINHQLFVASADGDGADAVSVGPLHRSAGGHNPFDYIFSPDGGQVVIWFNDTSETWLVDAAGGPGELVSWGELGDPPDWQRLAP